MASQSFFAILQYAGHGFEGWQRQPTGRTVQAVLEDGLGRLLGDEPHVTTNASGRTDSGVHALGQVVSFTAPARWQPDDLLRALNAVTPPDLWVAKVGHAPTGFHARKHAVGRRYRFLLGCNPAAESPFRQPYEWMVLEPLDGECLQAAARAMLGDHDFRAFSAVGQEKSHYRCTIQVSEWRERPNKEGFIFVVQADRFLHRMVRFLVGTMVDVGRGRRPLADIPALLQATSNQGASPPAPAHGLYLVGALYDEPELRRINEFVLQQ